MCGITGFIDHNHCVNENDLKIASASLVHRGGDGQGLIYEEKSNYTVGLANERLATIDLSKNSQQPLTSTCGNYSITFNGTIYNYLELRESLIKYGTTFSTLSDTEVILESYKKWGVSAFERLDGSFAFALLDRKLSQLLIAKDEIGTKPLYYFKVKGFYAFASEIKALLSLPIVEKKINKNAIGTYFRFGYFKGNESIYQDILKQKKGILTTIDLHSGNSYDMPLIRTANAFANASAENEEEILTKIEELLTDSILKRNVADVPIGVLLSGGYDSATVAAILQKNQTKRIKTYTVGFEDKKIDGSPQARLIAEHLKTNHQEYYLDASDALKIAETLPDVFDEPMGDSGAIPLLFIAERASNEVKVLLGAHGGDELFGGYRTYEKAIKLNDIDQSKLPKLSKLAITTWLKLTQPRMKEVLIADGLLDKYLEVSACFTLIELERLLKTPLIAKKGRKNNADSIKGLLIHDLHHYLPDALLYKSDRCFKYFGIDNRDALLKMDLISFLTALDPKWFIKDGQQKYLLKKITNQYVPASLMTKPKKGFVIPLKSWLKTSFKPLVQQHLTKEKLNAHQLLNTDEVLTIKNSFYRHPKNHTAQQLWMILQFQMWYERWIEIM